MKRVISVCAAAFIGLGLLSEGQASTAVISVSTDLGSWIGKPVEIGDKVFWGLDWKGFAKDQAVEFIWIDPGTPANFADDVFTVQLTHLENLVGSDFALHYIVRIMNPGYTFRDAALDVDHSGDTSIATTSVFGGPTGSDVPGVFRTS